MQIINELIQWTKITLEPLGASGLFILAFIESSFFPIPPDLLLIALTLANPKLGLFYALVCTIGSSLGGMFGYLIGYVGKVALLEKMFQKHKIEKVHKLFNKYEAWAIAIAGFTPIPYKVFTISGGVFYIDFKKFAVVSFFSRGARFFIEAGFIILFGEKILEFLNNYFGIFSIALFILLIGGYFAYKKLSPLLASALVE